MARRAALRSCVSHAAGMLSTRPQATAVAARSVVNCSSGGSVLASFCMVVGVLEV